MRIRYSFAGAFTILSLLAAYLGFSTIQISSVNDKLLHFGFFFLITLTLYWALDFPRRLVLKIVLSTSLALSVLSELVQGYLDNGREFDGIDIVANVLGSMLALGLCAWYHKRMLERKRRQKLESYGLLDVGDAEEDIELGEGSGEQELGVVGSEEDDGAGEAWDDIGGGPADEETGDAGKVNGNVAVRDKSDT